MKVKLLYNRVTQDLRMVKAGEVLDVSSEEAERLIDRGSAVAYREVRAPETASLAATRTGTKKRGRPRKKKADA